VRGCRQPFLNPLRLYVVIFCVHAFLSAVATPILTLADRATAVDPTGLVMRLAAKRTAVPWGDPAVAAHLAARAHGFAGGATLLIVLILAVAQRAVLRRYHCRYLEHLALALSVAVLVILVETA
jgi:hypothetical protein